MHHTEDEVINSVMVLPHELLVGVVIAAQSGMDQPGVFGTGFNLALFLRLDRCWRRGMWSGLLRHRAREKVLKCRERRKHGLVASADENLYDTLMFITFEGLDFSGKTTQANLLAERLRERKRTVRMLREPGGTDISERVRTILLDTSLHAMTDTAELLLFSASRAQLVEEVIVPSLRRGEVILCDRFHDSTTAYQGYGRGLDLDAIRHIHAVATVGCVPDMTFLVDIPVDEIERRKNLAGLTFDRMESAGREFYERVRKGYLAMARQEPHRIILLDGRASIEETRRSVWAHVEQRFSIQLLSV